MFDRVTDKYRHDDYDLTLKEIEQLEYKYLKKYWYFLKYAEDEIIRGFDSKNDINPIANYMFKRDKEAIEHNKRIHFTMELQKIWD